MSNQFADKPGTAGLVTLNVHNPSGVLEVVQFHAARLDELDGKTI